MSYNNQDEIIITSLCWTRLKYNKCSYQVVTMPDHRMSSVKCREYIWIKSHFLARQMNFRPPRCTHGHTNIARCSLSLRLATKLNAKTMFSQNHHRNIDGIFIVYCLSDTIAFWLSAVWLWHSQCIHFNRHFVANRHLRHTTMINAVCWINKCVFFVLFSSFWNMKWQIITEMFMFFCKFANNTKKVYSPLIN